MHQGRLIAISFIIFCLPLAHFANALTLKSANCKDSVLHRSYQLQRKTDDKGKPVDVSRDGALTVMQVSSISNPRNLNSVYTDSMARIQFNVDRSTSIIHLTGILIGNTDKGTFLVMKDGTKMCYGDYIYNYD